MNRSSKILKAKKRIRTIIKEGYYRQMWGDRDYGPIFKSTTFVGDEDGEWFDPDDAFNNLEKSKKYRITIIIDEI